ncbi:MAG: peptide-methionine (S)-S-oxide reductase MsrA [Flavobacteriales bacterium]|nr:peptide-methionine (S)-S-oxide reductase MsrA [Flavobacteriales bacterium]MCX7648977.1 peptide-methionine (S)-S-oxide reductase MsrA [Flavobacteriales bacterium]MDW8431857.1 peptide-methionine (S)-S-oxide reductase MsrA [Flavobacteriales bacterium]
MEFSNSDTIYLGAGCFWCVEAVFKELEGVLSVTSGYMGGHVPHPTYKQVCSGTTGHAEVCRVVFDPQKISFDDILEVYWQTHDPTTPNRQGNDVGTQYRSVIFYTLEKQKERAEYFKQKLNSEKVFPAPVITEIAPAAEFYPAEDYHQNYFSQNPDQPYCQYVIRPKLEKFRKVFAHKLKR